MRLRGLLWVGLTLACLTLIPAVELENGFWAGALDGRFSVDVTTVLWTWTLCTVVLIPIVLLLTLARLRRGEWDG